MNKNVHIREVKNGFIIVSVENGQEEMSIAPSVSETLRLVANLISPADAEAVDTPVTKPTPKADAVTKTQVEKTEVANDINDANPHNDGNIQSAQTGEADAEVDAKAAKAARRKEAAALKKQEKKAAADLKAAEEAEAAATETEAKPTGITLPEALPYSPDAPDQVAWVKQLRESIAEQTCSGHDVSICLRLHACIHGINVTKGLIAKMGYTKPSEVPDEKAPAIVALFFANIITAGITADDMDEEDF